MPPFPIPLLTAAGARLVCPNGDGYYLDAAIAAMRELARVNPLGVVPVLDDVHHVSRPQEPDDQ